MDYKKNNKRKIKKDLEAIRRNADERAERSMIELLKASVEYALLEHDDKHTLHLKMGDTYGWVLLRDGVEVAREVTAFDNMAMAQTNSQIARKVSQTKRKGWVGIVIAGMRGDIFSFDFEIDVLTVTKDQIKELVVDKFRKAKPLTI